MVACVFLQTDIISVSYTHLDVYKRQAHISSEGEIRYYVDGLPDDVVSRIEQAAAREQQKALFSAAYKVGDRVYLDGKPFEITRVDDWNVELMDRSVQNPQPRLEQKDSFMRLVQQDERSSRFAAFYNEYSEIKSANPDSLVLYQMGDFFEVYGEDAQTVSEALELNLASRSIGGNQRTQMCGFPANRLETYMNMLLDRGFDVTISSLENGERKTRNVVSTNKEDPVQSKPIGRIDYLHTDGTVRESVEYTKMCIRDSPSTSALVLLSRLPVGSSASTIAGLVIKARAIATRCCWPPERLFGIFFSLSSSPSR